MHFTIIVSCIFFYKEQLLAQIEKDDIIIDIMFTIVMLFCSMVALGFLIWVILWDNPEKRFYLFKKEHDEKIVPKVREKFDLTSDFKEVLSKSEYRLLHCYAKETENGILVSIRNENGEELESEVIKNYNYFDLNYEPKV